MERTVCLYPTEHDLGQLDFVFRLENGIGEQYDSDFNLINSLDEVNHIDWFPQELCSKYKQFTDQIQDWLALVKYHPYIQGVTAVEFKKMVTDGKLIRIKPSDDDVKDKIQNLRSKEGLLTLFYNAIVYVPEQPVEYVDENSNQLKSKCDFDFEETEPLQLTALDDILLTDYNQPVADSELLELKQSIHYQSSSPANSSNEIFVRRSTRKRKRPDWLVIHSDNDETPTFNDKRPARESPNRSPIRLFCRKEDLALMTCVNHLGPNWKEIKKRMTSFGFERNSSSSFSDRWNRLQGRYILAYNFINDYNSQFNQTGIANGNQYDSNNNLIVESNHNGYHSRL